MNSITEETAKDREIPSSAKTFRIRAKTNFICDGNPITKDSEINVTPRQYHANARFCVLLEGDEHPAPQSPQYTQVKNKKGEYTWEPGTPGPLSYEADQDAQSKRFSDAVAAAVATTLQTLGITAKAAAKAAALILLGFCLFGGMKAKAATPSTYGKVPSAMLTNGVPPTTTNTAVSSVIGLTKFDQVSLTVTNQLPGGSSVGTGTNWIFVYPSNDGVLFDTNHPIASFAVTAPASTNAFFVTNLSNLVLGSTGYIQLGAGNVTAGTVITNLGVQVWAKPIRSGT